MKKLAIIIVGIAALYLFTRQESPAPPYSPRLAAPHPHRLPSPIIRPKAGQWDYNQLRTTLLGGMPKQTRVKISYRFSFMENGRFLKDVLLVETTFPDGRRYAFNASYDPRTQKIIRTWGGNHDISSVGKFSLPAN